MCVSVCSHTQLTHTLTALGSIALKSTTLALPSSCRNRSISGGERFASGHPCSAAPSHIAVTGSATCVQSLDDSLGSAIRTTYRISLRSSSVQEPRHPLHRVVFLSLLHSFLLHPLAFSLSLSFSVCLFSLNPPLLSLSISLSRMILPQVHLRKPCYDFTFL